MDLKDAVIQLFNIVYLILILRILLSWFPNVDWYKQPFKLLDDLSEPILGPFRKIIPPIGGIDLSPIVAFFALQIVLALILKIL